MTTTTIGDRDPQLAWEPRIPRAVPAWERWDVLIEFRRVQATKAGLPAPLPVASMSEPRCPRDPRVPARRPRRDLPLSGRRRDVLEAATAIEAEGGVVTHRAIARRLGLRGSGSIEYAVRRLREMRLWTWG